MPYPTRVRSLQDRWPVQPAPALPPYVYWADDPFGFSGSLPEYYDAVGLGSTFVGAEAQADALAAGVEPAFGTILLTSKRAGL